MELTLLQHPLAIALYAVALALVIFELITKFTGYVLPLIALAVFVGTSIYAVLSGVTLFEIACLATVFLVANLFGCGRKKG